MLREPLLHSSFSLDSSGVAGFFGGDEAVSAMATVNLYKGRRWWGWYNSPGSYEIAKKYGQLAKSQYWDGLFPGPNVDPATLFGLDGSSGPAYTAARSGTTIAQTSHIAHLIMQDCKQMTGKVFKGHRESTKHDVTIATLCHAPEKIENPPPIPNKPYLAIIPIAASAAACVACFVYHDWYSATMILLGMFASGISCLVIGSGTLVFKHPRPAKGSPPGDGILMSGTHIVALRGEESAVNSITRGSFSLEFKRLQNPNQVDEHYTGIGVCSVLLTAQFLAQLLLIPQGQLFGQFMFLATLAVSWAYNLHLSSIDKEKVQRQILTKNILHNPTFVKYTLGSRTTAAVFSALVLDADPENLEPFLLSIIPNQTRVWKIWRSKVVQRIAAIKVQEPNLEKTPSTSSEHDTQSSNEDEIQPYTEDDWKVDGMASGDQKLLESLFKDAEDAQVAYRDMKASSQPYVSEMVEIIC